jgi:hypothetical protein
LSNTIFTEAEVAQLRLILQSMPETERSKIKAIIKSGRLVSFVKFMDSIIQFFERLGIVGSWINNVLRPILTSIIVIVAAYMVMTGKLPLSEFWK